MAKTESVDQASLTSSTFDANDDSDGLVIQAGTIEQAQIQLPGVPALVQGVGVFSGSTTPITWTAAANVVTDPTGDGNWEVAVGPLDTLYGAFANPALTGFAENEAISVWGDPSGNIDSAQAADNVAIQFDSPVPAGNSFLLTGPGGTLDSGDINETGPFTFTFVAALNGVPVSTLGWTFAVETPSGDLPAWNYSVDPLTGTVTVNTIDASLSGPDAVIVATPDTAITTLSVTAETIPVDAWSLSVAPESATLCFCAGTHIGTPTGEIPVERLTIGDTALTHRGEARDIVWIGVGHVLATRGQRGAATPVIVRKGALADNVPHHDLRVTKGHALYLDDVLIPVEFLVNHRSILWDDRAQEVVLYHIELSGHDVLLANGAPAESYRDDGNRWLFGNAKVGPASPPALPFAPVLTGGSVVDTVWRRLLERSGPRPHLPLTGDPDLHLLVDGARLDAASRHDMAYIFRLRSRPKRVRIVSLSGAPAELGLARDPRALGVAVRRIALRQGTRFRIMEATDAAMDDGFYAFEPNGGLRWTDGDAALPQMLFEGFDGPMEVVLHLGGATQYPLLARTSERVAA